MADPLPFHGHPHPPFKTNKFLSYTRVFTNSESAEYYLELYRQFYWQLQRENPEKIQIPYIHQISQFGGPNFFWVSPNIKLTCTLSFYLAFLDSTPVIMKLSLALLLFVSSLGCALATEPSAEKKTALNREERRQKLRGLQAGTDGNDSGAGSDGTKERKKHGFFSSLYNVFWC
jgi:hypothetical protein